MILLYCKKLLDLMGLNDVKYQGFTYSTNLNVTAFLQSLKHI